MATDRTHGPTTSRTSSPTSGSARPGPRTFGTFAPGSSTGPWSTTGPFCSNSPAISSRRQDRAAGATSLERLVVAARQEAQRETFRLAAVAERTGGAARRPAHPRRSGDGPSSPGSAVRPSPTRRRPSCAGAAGHPEAGGSTAGTSRPEPQPAQAPGPARPAAPARPCNGCRKNGGIRSWWPSSTSRWSTSPTRRSTSSTAAWPRRTRAGHDLEEFRGSMAQATNETVRLFGELARVVLDPTVRDAQLRRAIYRRIPPERLRKAVEESSGIVRPDDDSGLDFLRKRYGHLRRFVPAFLAAFPFRSNVDPDPLLKAVDLLRRLGERRGRSLPRSTAVDFVPAKWRPYVIDGQGRIDRAYFELCVLSELRAALAGRRCLAGIQPSLLRPGDVPDPQGSLDGPARRGVPAAPGPRRGHGTSDATRGRAGGAPGTSRPLAEA